MIVTDLDDTLLRNDKSVSDHTVSVLARCRAAGIKIVFATARSSQSASKYFKSFAPDVFIGYGGALMHAGGEVIKRFEIPADVSFRLINECLREPEIINVHAVNERAALMNCVETLDPEASHYTYADLTVENGMRYLKISLIALNPAVVSRIAENFPSLDVLRYSNENLYRFAAKEAVKWNAVKAAAEYYAIDTDDVVAFGDDVNDLEMIKNCGAGVAVANAVDAVKLAAKYICGSNERDGVAEWIATNVLR